MGPALVPTGVVGVLGDATVDAIVGDGGAKGGNFVKLINVMSSGLRPFS